ncbi:MAG: nucleoside monophosphate kinase [Candidatus Saccharicenans sp.]|uniref:nucleoside monophosphate kinase n=1 Tax=Candidatus Saccharicenans sp. TaxID=2819258 RepID=UPI00404B134C
MKAFLIIGPPGSGKSPLGDYLEKQSLPGKRFWHFDFGRLLREITRLENAGKNEASTVEPGPQASASQVEAFSPAELARVRQSLQTSSLFEEHDKELVRKIFRYYLSGTGVGPEDILLLNGLPRHRAQVAWLQDLVNIVLVINLDCPEEIAVRRILANLDGERQGREDDRLEVIVRRYRLYLEKTGPLIDFLRQSGVPVIELKVERETRPETLWLKLQASQEFQTLL